ncbi:hypothetical protein PR048_031161 [Dryococelus australis]|uniref:Uncharacterized protein n=1 Tax=Dryococelus australis TaxID=614101 RepID=A0ABQ9G4G8_9NEOP|nr:hypothetical protein PR048_031161 [Dryococelus australis]
MEDLHGFSLTVNTRPIVRSEQMVESEQYEQDPLLGLFFHFVHQRQQWNAVMERMGVHREKLPTIANVHHVSYRRKSRNATLGIESDSLWWEASYLHNATLWCQAESELGDARWDRQFRVVRTPSCITVVGPETQILNKGEINYKNRVYCLLCTVYTDEFLSHSLLVSGYGVERLERLLTSRVGEMGDPRENPLTSSIVLHDSHLRKSRNDTSRNQTGRCLPHRLLEAETSAMTYYHSLDESIVLAKDSMYPAFKKVVVEDVGSDKVASPCLLDPGCHGGEVMTHQLLRSLLQGAVAAPYPKETKFHPPRDTSSPDLLYGGRSLMQTAEMSPNQPAPVALLYTAGCQELFAAVSRSITEKRPTCNQDYARPLDATVMGGNTGVNGAALPYAFPMCAMSEGLVAEPGVLCDLKRDEKVGNNIPEASVKWGVAPWHH